MSTNYNLEATHKCALWLGFLQKIDCTIFNEFQLPLCCFNIFEIWWVYSWTLCLIKGLWHSSVVVLLSRYAKSVQIRSFFWSVFSRIWTEYGEILRISPYSVRMRENTVQKKLRIWTLFTQCLFINLFLLQSKTKNTVKT